MAIEMKSVSTHALEIIPTTSRALLITVTCSYCKRHFPEDQISEVHMVEDAGYREDGVKPLRATGETRYQCVPCFGAWFDARVAAGELEDDDDDE